MKKDESSPQLGEFSLNSQTVTGLLHLDGENTSLKLNSKESFDTNSLDDKCITGIMHDNIRVSLFNCVTPPIPGHGWNGEETHYFANVIPNYVLLGNRHLLPNESDISAISFLIEDATTLFYDFDAFGSILKKECNIKDFLQQAASDGDKPFEIGDFPRIFYYTGKSTICSAKTKLGTVLAHHAPTTHFPSPDGITVKNNIPLRIEFASPLSFSDAMKAFQTVLIFAETLLGAPQNIKSIHVELKTDAEIPVRLEVHSPMQPKYSAKERKPHPADVLINGGMESEQFSKVLSRWIERSDDWQDSRFRFIQSFRQQYSYSIDRLIAAANVFDILPESAAGIPEPLSTEAQAAIDSFKKTVKGLTSDEEKKSIFNVLKYIKNRNLKSKIKNRASLLPEAIIKHLPELDLVIDEAVNTRNFFVHGTEGRLSSKDTYEFLFFFTDILEFIFGASDLIEAGWNIDAWKSKGSCLTHPFANTLHGYPEALKQLKQKISSV